MTTAYVLPEAAVSGSEPVFFGGFPGRWHPGRPIEASEIMERGGFDSEDALRAAIAELGLPLERTTVEAGAAPMPAAANHLPSQSQADAVAKTVARKRPRSHAEADALAADLGVEFPDDATTVAEKADFLDGLEG